jgi:hypothetical protein
MRQAVTRSTSPTWLLITGTAILALRVRQVASVVLGEAISHPSILSI